jgi:thymidylate synthase
MLTHILANHCGLIADEFVYFLGNCHIYEDHLDALKEQIERIPLEFPTIRIKNIRDSIDDYMMDDIEWTTPYLSHTQIKMKMSA